jgi:alpha-galactosidase
MPKITLLGAGSTVFAKRLLVDLLSFPELAESTISLHDIDEVRLNTSEVVAHKVAEAVNAHPTIEASLDRRASLDGADYVICMIQVAGYDPGTVLDFEIPKRYGLEQTIGDTLGIGGIMRALRTIPVMLDMCKDMEEVCPDTMLLNHTNPMAMVTWAIDRGSSIRQVGLCHSVHETAGSLAADIGVPLEEISYLCAGINHMAFYLRFERVTKDGAQDLYPLIDKVIEEGRVPDSNRVRYDMYPRLGYFVTESSEHFSEYVPWFIKRDRPDLIERYRIPLDEYLRRCEGQIGMWREMQAWTDDPHARLDQPPPEMMAAAERVLETTVMSRGFVEEIFDVRPSGEYTSLMIHSLETGIPRVTYGNVPNRGLIDNLPPGCAVEVPCLTDRNGVRPIPVGPLPPHLAALLQTNITPQSMAVEAALSRKREHIYHAAMLDPHTAAELDLDQIWSMVDDLIEAHADWLPAYH